MVSVSKLLRKGLLLTAMLVASVFGEDKGVQNRDELSSDEYFKKIRSYQEEVYTEINIEASNAILDRLEDEDEGTIEDESVIEEVIRNPGIYTPEVLAVVGASRALHGSLEEGVRLLTYGRLRAIIDCMWCQNLEAAEEAMMVFGVMHFGLTIDLNEEDSVLATKIAHEAWDNFEAWDKQTPRDYDFRWPLLRGLDTPIDTRLKSVLSDEDREAKQAMFYRQIRGGLLPEDVAHITSDGEYFFDVEARKFYLQEEGKQFLSIKVPLACNPVLDILGREYISTFKFRKTPGAISFGYEKSTEFASFDELYKDQLEYLDEKESLEKCLIGNTQAYKKRMVMDRFVFYHYGLFGKDKALFSIGLTTDQDNESQDLAILEEILSSITWHTQEVDDA